MADLVSGRREPTRDLISRLLDELAPVARELGSATELEAARGLLDSGGADAQRTDAREGGILAVARGLADRFLTGV
jgi:gamma-glutamyl:cysteine ligase YbdK (ATP-grasp superfamily)